MNKKTFILIADGGQARLLFHSDKQPHLKLMDSWKNKPGHVPEGDTVTDSPGTNRHGSMVSEVDPQRHAQATFAKQLATILQERLTGYDQLIVAAAPKFLGDLRKEFHGTVREKVVAELDKDLTHIALHDLPSHFESLVEK